VSFTIPSIHDDTTLDARIYHPADAKSSPFDNADNGKRGAIIAHPYAPLGGSYDDPVVSIVAAQVLKEGFVVCTFNFRYEVTSPLDTFVN
jgi:alpha/beta superfamily hydrolase